MIFPFGSERPLPKFFRKQPTRGIIMKTKLVSLLAFWVVLSFSSLSFAQYTGGSHDGYGMGTSVSDIALPVILSSFTASASDKQVTLSWITESELDNLGFHVWRAIEKDGTYERITTELIRGAGNSSGKNTYSFTDLNVVKNVTYWYKLEDIAFDGSSKMHGPISIRLQVVVNQTRAVPSHFALYQNSPNPFNPSTTIAYDLPEATDVTLTVYNLSGQKVATLVTGKQKAGHYEVEWDGQDESGQAVASGVYLYRLETGKQGFVETRRMMLVR